MHYINIYVHVTFIYSVDDVKSDVNCEGLLNCNVALNAYQRPSDEKYQAQFTVKM